MTARLLFVLVLYTCTGEIYSQTPVSDSFKIQKAAAKLEAQKMATLLLEKKYEAFAVYVHPNITKMAGGQKKMVAMLKSSMDGLEKQGVGLTSAKIQDPLSMIKEGNQFQAVIPQEMELKVPDGTLQQTAFIIGISNDGGKKWTFIDTSNKTIEQIRQVLPTLSQRITVPDKTPPVYHKN